MAIQESARPAPDGKRILGALGLTQILAWGMSYYLPTMLAAPIAADTGWPLTFVVAGFSMALLSSGMMSPMIGRLISVRGGRLVLSGGAVTMAAGLTILGLAPNLWVFALGWIVIGLAMSASLYDPAFSTLGRIYGAAARRPITLLTLFGGFASTVCWPLSAWLVENIGWRGTCLTYAAIQIGFSLPLLLFGLPGERDGHARASAGGSLRSKQVKLAGRDRQMFLLLSAALVCAGVLVTVLSVHLVTLLQAREVSMAAAVSLGMLIGPAQVAGRVLEMAFGKRYHPVWTLVGASVLIAVGILVLYLGFRVPALCFILYGAGNGIWTIARGSLPLALFGARDYPVLMGQLAMPSLVAQALAPVLGALLIEAGSAEWVFALIAGLALANVCLALTLLKFSLEPPGKSDEIGM